MGAGGAAAVATVEDIAGSDREPRQIVDDTTVGEGFGRTEAFALGRTGDVPQPPHARGMPQL
jgi:hypothetical protein